MYSKNKIYLIFAGIGGFFLLFALLLLNQGITIKRVSGEIENNWLPSILAVNSINTLTSDYRTLEALHIMATDLEAKEKYARAMQGVVDEITQAQSDYESRISSDKERTLYQKFSKSYDSYLVASKQVITLSENNDAVRAAVQLKRNGNFFKTLSDELLKLVELNSVGSTESVNHASQTFTRTQIILLVGTGLAVAALLFFTIMLNKAQFNSTDPLSISANKKKITVTFLLLIGCFLIFSGLFYQQISRINLKVLEMKSSWIPSIIMVNSLNTKTSDYRVAEALHILSTDANEMAKYDAEINAISGNIANLRKKYSGFMTSKEERSLYDDFSTAYTEYLTTSKQTLTFSRANDNINAIKFLTQSSTLAEDFSSLLLELVSLNQEGGGLTPAVLWMLVYKL